MCWTHNRTEAHVEIVHLDCLGDLMRLESRGPGAPPYIAVQHGLMAADAPRQSFVDAWRGSLMTVSFQVI